MVAAMNSGYVKKIRFKMHPNKIGVPADVNQDDKGKILLFQWESSENFEFCNGFSCGTTY
jgi:hypothetical protein